MWGDALEAEIKGVEAKTKAEMNVKVDRVMRKWLDMPLQYRDPVAAGKVQMPTKDEEV